MEETQSLASRAFTRIFPGEARNFSGKAVEFIVARARGAAGNGWDAAKARHASAVFMSAQMFDGLAEIRGGDRVAHDGASGCIEKDEADGTRGEFLIGREFLHDRFRRDGFR